MMSSSLRSDIDSDLMDDGDVRYTDDWGGGGSLLAPYGVVRSDSGCPMLICSVVVRRCCALLIACNVCCVLG